MLSLLLYAAPYVTNHIQSKFSSLHASTSVTVPCKNGCCQLNFAQSQGSLQVLLHRVLCQPESAYRPSRRKSNRRLWRRPREDRKPFASVKMRQLSAGNLLFCRTWLVLIIVSSNLGPHCQSAEPYMNTPCLNKPLACA